MTADRAALLKELGRVQNHPANVDHDIMTITGFMTDAEIVAHIETNRAAAVDFDTIAAVAKALGVKLSHGFVA